MHIYQYIVFLNGIYDIICAYCIMFAPNTLMGSLHTSIFIDATKLAPLTCRMLAYWLYTYGGVRISIIYTDTKIIVASTYFIEAAVYAYETLAHSTTYSHKSIWVITTSLILGYMIL